MGNATHGKNFYIANWCAGWDWMAIDVNPIVCPGPKAKSSGYLGEIKVKEFCSKITFGFHIPTYEAQRQVAVHTLLSSLVDLIVNIAGGVTTIKTNSGSLEVLNVLMALAGSGYQLLIAGDDTTRVADEDELYSQCRYLYSDVAANLYGCNVTVPRAIGKAFRCMIPYSPRQETPTVTTGGTGEVINIVGGITLTVDNNVPYHAASSMAMKLSYAMGIMLSNTTAEIVTMIQGGTTRLLGMARTPSHPFIPRGRQAIA